MNYDWAVLFTKYCQGINDGSVTSYTREEDDAAAALFLITEMAAERIRQNEVHTLAILEQTAWKSESSGKYKHRPVKRKSAA